MDSPQILPRVDDNHVLKQTLESWDKDRLIQYALNLSKASAEQEEAGTILAENVVENRMLRGLMLVQEIGENLASLELNHVLTRLLKLINEALDVEDGSILLVEEPSKDLIFQTSLGSISQEIKPFRVPRGQGIAGEVAQHGEPIRIENAQTDARHFKQIDHDTGFLTKSILCVPLKTRDKIIGVVEVFNKQSGPFTEADEALLGSIANYAAISIENARLHQSVIAERDRAIQAQEEVSNKLQRDLHDGPTQLVAAMQMSIEFCKTALEKEISLVGPELDNMHLLAERATHQMRTLLFELRPLELETQGLAAALKTFIDKRQKTEKTALHLDIQTDQLDNLISRLQDKYESALFAITQEAVNNSLKYAKADNIFVRVQQQDNHIELSVLDDGLGFDLHEVTSNYEGRGSYGLVNQRERAALLGSELDLKSALGAGTETIIRFTISPEMKR